MTKPNHNDDDEPSDQDIADLNRSLAELNGRTAKSNERYVRRRKKHGPDRAASGIWNDNPEGREIWKATIAGLATAYQELSPGKGHAIDMLAEAAGLENEAKGITVVPKSGRTIGLAPGGRPFSPGDSGKNVKRFIEQTRVSQNRLVQTEFERAKAGVLLFEELDDFRIYVGSQGPLVRPKILQSIKRYGDLTLREALDGARMSGKRCDVDIACGKLLLAAEAHGVGRYLFHSRRKGRSKA